MTFAEEGSSPLNVATTMVNGLGEEVFFRGALYAALDADRAVMASTAVYTLATASTRNPALMLAAGVMGTLFSLQRRASGGLQAPLLTHLTWSALMVRFLPRLFQRARSTDLSARINQQGDRTPPAKFDETGKQASTGS
ncbi:MAG: CPBP family intramembrane glutamic endopeptidase [Nocardioidaceae bacterium]